MDLFFVADDFTGGVDVLFQSAKYGQVGTMFLSDEAFLAADSTEMPNCTGVATTFRRSAPEMMKGGLQRILDRASELSPRVVQYKICSTADSSPRRGSIRPAFDLFMQRGAKRVALLVAQPGLRRYTFFGHHFANDRGTVYRLDRQPTMSSHPSTPMRESDLRLHFAKQIGDDVGTITIEDLLVGPSLKAGWEREHEAGRSLVVLDAVNAEDLATHGKVLVQDRPAYVIGSGGATQGIGTGLGWKERETSQVPAIAASGPVLVVVGSCSALTSVQIDHVSGRSDWAVLPWDPLNEDPESVAANAHAGLEAGKHVLVHSQGAGSSSAEGLGDRVPRGLAHVVSKGQGQFSRLVIAGGDTSGDVLTFLGAEKLTITAILDQQTPLCRVDFVKGEPLEIILKGGQIGGVDYFLRAVRGGGSGEDAK